MNRRAVYVALIALCAACAAFLARAQPRSPLIGILYHGVEPAGRTRVASLREGLRELGYHDDKNYRIEVRWSENQMDRLPALAKELVALRPDVLVASIVRPAQALHRETKTIPIVMAGGAGAQNLGLVASLARPGGNVTGLTNQGDELTAKLLELLREIAPQARRVVTLSSGLGSVEAEIRTDSRAAAKRYGMELIEALADSPAKLSSLSARCAVERCEALVSLLDPNLANFRKEIIALAAKLRIPAVYAVLGFAEEGGLAAYSADTRKQWRRAATYIDKILKGAKPGELPIEQPTHFELVINQKAARTIGIKIPQSVLLRADRVIE